ncbi:MAG: elongation factor 4 [Candidatus Doudnabacteria bacterium]|nr:elongation factor 4 [Candidatus Doudnabacteria bacterium]
MSAAEKIRNFCIIAHIDHGKSTLADRLLEVTHTLAKREMKDQLLDTMDLERERGITIKLQPVRMEWTPPQTNADSKQTNADKGLLYEDLSYSVRGAIFEVRKQLGSGHKENVYQKALALELKQRSIPFVQEKEITVSYKGAKVGVYRPDFLVDNKIILEIKALPLIGRKEEAQLWNYLKGTPHKLALLVNFGPDGAEIKRLINSDQSASSPPESVYVLNLIDTPGHVDFTYEVSRSLAACEGAILVVDSTQGIEAQTIANVHLAQQHKLKIIPVVNKIDLPNAEREKTAAEIVNVFGFKKEDILFASGKTGEGVEEILQQIVARIPSPNGKEDQPLRALIFDSKYDQHRGVVIFVRIVDGQLKKNEKIQMLGTKTQSQALEVGFFKPKLFPAIELATGEVGYIVTGLREVRKARVGDTVTTLQSSNTAKALPGYKQVKPMVYASIFPTSGDDYPLLRDAMDKLKLNDAALEFEAENLPALGFGFRAGFLGLLHMDIVQERLSREYDLDLILTAPSVEYKVNLKNGDSKIVHTPAELPDPSHIESVEEPWVLVEILIPQKYIGGVMELITARRGIYKNTDYVREDRVMITAEIPLANIIIDFYDKLKSISSGYASLNYELLDLREAELVKLDILVAQEKVDALSLIVHKEVAESEGRSLVEKLKTVIPRQQFEVALQAAIGSKIVARETIPAMRKDVTAKLYGGDVTRKMKLLEKQKKGKKRLKRVGSVDIPQEAFLAILKK